MRFCQFEFKCRVLLFFLLVLSCSGCAGINNDKQTVRVLTQIDAASSKVQEGSAFIDFTGISLEGKPWTLSDFVGSRSLVLQFWGVRCSPCLAEMKFLSEIQKKVGDQKLMIVGINTDRQSPETLAAEMVKKNIQPSYQVVIDDALTAAKHYTNWLMPVVVIIDKQGIVKLVHTGYGQKSIEMLETEILRYTE